MEPLAVAGLGFAMGALDLAIARGLEDRSPRAPRVHAQERARDFYVLAWYALAGSGFLAFALALAAWSGMDDLALLGTIRVALVVSFILACASLLGAGGHHLAAARASSHPKG